MFEVFCKDFIRKIRDISENERVAFVRPANNIVVFFGLNKREILPKFRKV